ncbi:MAG TPA: YrhK family protein [Bacillales bacterium]|nr:YrhK family protein [Bacillales bacterium]
MANQKESNPIIKETRTQDGDYELQINLEKHRIVIHNRYEWIHILNDGLQAIWFLIGSVFFFYSSLQEAAIWLFVIGSAQMAIRPIIRIAHKVHRKEIETKIKNINP